MILKEVINEADARTFLEVPIAIYRNDPEWIRPLDKDINDVFNPNKNKFFRHGEAIRWLLLDDSGKAVGRVAAFINKRTANREAQPTGGMGFFECPDNQQAANLLFDACRDWLKARGMEAMDGPVNFGERDRWWGLLVKGFFAPGYAEAHANAGSAYGMMQRYDDALASLFQAVRWDPGYAQAYYFIGVTYRLKGDEQNARAYIAKAQALDPTIK